MAHQDVVTTKHEARYARKLDELDAQRAAGAVSPNAYELQRAKFMKEAAKQPWHWGIQLAVILGILIAFLLVLRLAGAFVTAVGT